MQVSDNVFLGPVYLPAQVEVGSPSSPQNGIGPLGRVFVFDVVPVTAGVALLAPLNAATGGVLPLVAGAGVTSRIDGNGLTRLVLDTPRNVSVTASGANVTTALVVGYDQYGQRMTEAFAAPNSSTVVGNKAFKEILSVTFSATPGATVSAGIGEKLGLPYAIRDAGYVSAVKWANTLADNAATVVNAVTAAATSSTGDVRGTVTPSSASNGTNRLVALLALTGAQCGPQATRLAAAGVDQA